MSQTKLIKLQPANSLMNASQHSSTIHRQISIANQVYKLLKAYSHNAFLLGGAPRDWAMGRLATDLDFYILDDAAINNQFDITQAMADINFRYILPMRYDNKDRDPSKLMYAHMFKTLNAHSSIQSFSADRMYSMLDRTQLIFLNKQFDPREILSVFACTLSEYLYNFEEQQVYTSVRNANYSADNKTLVKLDETDSEYICKIKQKFPDYSFLKFRY